MSEDKNMQIIGLIRDTIRAAEPTAQIILYGSRARGDAREDSEWDVFQASPPSSDQAPSNSPPPH